MILKTDFNPTKQDINIIEKWLIEEDKKTDLGFYVDWEDIIDAFNRNNLAVLRLNDSVIGFISYKLGKIQSRIEIAEVHPDYRKNGFGRKFVEVCLSYFKRKGILVVDLECKPKWSEVVWSKLGFVKFPEKLMKKQILMFKPLVNTIKPSFVYSNDEMVELWDSDEFQARKNQPKWLWEIGDTINRYPIIWPTDSYWQVFWRKRDKVIEKSRVGRFSLNEFEGGSYLIIT